MSRYLVTFFKHLLSSDGHIFKSPQQSFEIRHAKSLERAVQAAERRYERLCKLAPGPFMRTRWRWRLMARRSIIPLPFPSQPDLDGASSSLHSPVEYR